jgi:preprotein translocase subunit SecG
MLPYLLMTLFLIVCILLIIVVLLQKGRGGGLSGAFGAGAGSSAFGTRTGDVFTWVTIVLTGLFLVLAIITALTVRPPMGAVAMPTFDPPGWLEGLKDKQLKVTMSCSTKGATIRYTTDGAEPTKKSLAYGESAVVVDRGMTLQARGFRAGMDPSPILSVTYAPPTTQPADSGGDAPEKPSVTVPAPQPDAEKASATPGVQPAGK